MKKKIIIIIISLLVIIIGIFTIFKINNKYLINNIVNTKLECLNKSNKCSRGTLINIKVNNKDNLDFYVIDDNGQTITLLMNENIGNNIKWTDNNDCSKGPNIIINTIKDITKNWDNIKTKNYLITDSAKCYNDQNEDLKARLLTYEEAISLGCAYYYKETCPSYLYNNLNDASGYWLSTTMNPNDDEAAYTIYKDGSIESSYIIENRYYGLRLVIELKK